MHLLYVPCPTQKQAKELATAILERKLAACANISSDITSMYEWEGTIQEESECILILKTLSPLDAEEFLTTKHPYETPCIITINTEKVNPAFLNWAHNL